MRRQMGLTTARSEKHTLETIHGPISELRITFPLAGAREMANLLFFECKMRVPRCVHLPISLKDSDAHIVWAGRDLIYEYFKVYESKLFRERKVRRIKRRTFWSAGVNDLICIDQHDKLKYLGLALHIGEDPFAGTIHWLKIYHNNNNPKLILSYYLDWMEEYGCTSYLFILELHFLIKNPIRYASYYTE